MNNNYDYNNYNDYNVKEEANNESKSEDISLYNDGEDKKPKLVIIIASIIGALILILIFAFACTKLNKKSSNNYLSSLSVTNAEMTPQFDKMALEYNVTTTEDTVAIKCSAEHKKAYTSGCDKRIYLQDECIEHTVSVTSQTKQVRKYELKICKQAKDAPIIKEVKKTPTTFTSSSVKVEVIAESKNKLHEEAYSFDGGMTYQKENYIEVSENKSLEIKVRDEKNNESAVLNEEIQNIDTTKPTVLIEGSTKNGEETTSNVLLTAVVNPDTTPSGYKYQWYKGSSKIKNATEITYNATSSGSYKVVVTTGSNNSSTSEVYTVKIKSTSSGGSSKPSGGNKKPNKNNNPSNNNQKVPPVVKVSGNPTKWTAENVTLKISATAVNGLHSTAYSFDGGKTYQKENSKTFTSNTKGTIVVRDKRGNSTKYEFNISKIDKTIPKVTISGDTSPKSKLTATVTPASTASGYKYQWYKGTAVITGETKQTYTPSTSGTYYVEVTTGSGKKVKSTGKTIKDQIKPTVTISGSSAWTNKNVTITSTIKNPGSIKINGYKWYKDNKEIDGATSKTYSAGSSGNYKVVVSTGAGNITSGTIKINIDKTAPSVPTLTHKAGNSNYSLGTWTNKTVTRTIKSSDASGSGIARFEYANDTSLCGKTGGSGNIEKVSASTIQNGKEYKINDLSSSQTNKACFRAVDKVGNASQWSKLYTVLIDKTPPYTPKIADNSNNKEVECHIINDGEIIGKGTSTTKHTACIGQVASSFNLNVVENDIGGSGMSSKCDIVWEHDGDKKACPIYGNYSSLDINISENYKMTGYNGIKWETINISKKPICANGATYVIYLKRCYDKAGNVSNMLFSFVSRNR
mgnify:CR=1 FL=1